MSENPTNHFLEHVEYQTELLELIDRKLAAVRIAAIVFLVIIGLQCLLGVLYIAGVFSLTRLFMR